MGREKGYKLSPERIKRMQLAKERRKKGITRHLYVVEILAEEKMKQLFKKWHLDIEDFLFVVDPYDRKDIVFDLRKEDLKFEPAVKLAVECLKNMKVIEVDLVCDDKQILKVTGGNGRIVNIEKKGKEYLVNDPNAQEWLKATKNEF